MAKKKRDLYIVEKQVDPVTGFVYEEYHLKNNKLHRTDGPARVIKIPENGYVCSEWFFEGERHRDSGEPALTVHYEPDGEIAMRGFYEHGTEIDPNIPPEIS